MISLYPTFYHAFQCKAQHCNHTCCQKWTIDIDDHTAAMYNNLNSPLGESLRQAMTIDKEGHHFVFTDEQPKCTLLRDDGLCKVVLELGEDSLCETCHMHPRFYKYIEDLELCGVGLCCEESVEKLIASNGNQLLFTIEDDDNEFGPDERPILQNIFELLALDVDGSLLQYTPSSNADYVESLLTLYSQTEPIDDKWTHQLVQLEALVKEYTPILHQYDLSSSDLGTLNKTYQYILYRQIDMLADYSLESLIQYAYDATTYILLTYIHTKDMVESIRRWSEQIEYNEDTIIFLFNTYETSE